MDDEGPKAHATSEPTPTGTAGAAHPLAQAQARAGRPLLVYADGACRGNPGHSGAGWVMCLEEGTPLAEGCLYLGHRTNNEAEYLAAALGLRAAADLGVREVELRADSELLVRQVQGVYQVRNARLKPLYEALLAVARRFERFGVSHVLRHRNSLADAQANRAIDTRPRL